ncbi:hypothetical protein DPMN_042191 [Dreissena polymorpha]|uniref:Uncharacterized protein n=1 Tax=Dreissena polymorpha TaxID=45954 RepID=A0A9D4HYK8_DREPO|nr:hypothetical protein DPMN_042191 [Dreissena polymorpha]
MCYLPKGGDEERIPPSVPHITNVLLASSRGYEKTAPPPGGHVFSLITTIFKLNQDIHKTNVLTKFHDNWDKKSKRPPPLLAAMFFLPIRTIFELNRRIQETNVLTKFHNN